MRFHLLIATIFALLVCGKVTSASTEIEQTKGSALGLSEMNYSTSQDRGGLLRTGNAADEAHDSMEERSVWKWAKVRYWLETEKSDEHVLKALKLNGKNEAAMKLEHNYKYYEYFAKKSLDYRLNGWLRSKTTTWDAWKKLLLQNKVTERGQLKDIADTSEFSIYVRYVNEYDNYMHTTLINSYSIPHLPIPRGASDAELYARVKIMAIAQREDAFAKVMLGLTDTVKRRRVTLKGNALMQHEDYKWYQLFGELKAAEAAATHT